MNQNISPKILLNMRYLIDDENTQTQSLNKYELSLLADLPDQSEEYFQLLLNTFYDKYNQQENLVFLFEVLIKEEQGFRMKIMNEEEILKQNQEIQSCQIFLVYDKNKNPVKNYFIQKYCECKTSYLTLKKERKQQDLMKPQKLGLKRMHIKPQKEEIMSKSQATEQKFINRSKNGNASISSFFKGK